MIDVVKTRQILQKTIDGTMNTLVDRWKSHPEYGWIDMKFSSSTGIDFFDCDNFRGRDSVYSWIQGRGLESLVSHISFYEKQGRQCQDLHDIATVLARKLRASLDSNGGHILFLVGQRPQDSRYTMSDLFCSRGLYSYYAAFGSQEDRKYAESYLRGTVNAILNGSFYNDQQTFEGAQYVKYEDGRTSYAGKMLALGAIVMLMKNSKASDLPVLGTELIDYVLDNHVVKAGCGLEENTIVEWMLGGKPAVNSDGTIPLDPGHALEFVGLAAQTLKVLKKYYKLSDDMSKWVEKVIGLLPALIRTGFDYGYVKPFGIAKGVDGLTRRLFSPTMPWWSLPETMRAMMLTWSLQSEDQKQEWLLDDFTLCLESFETYFVGQSVCNVPIQTLGQDGKPSPVIPATPDLDPGYHTGQSFISILECLND